MKILEIGSDFDGVVVYTDSFKAYYILNWYEISIPLHRCSKKIITGEGLLTSSQYNKVRDKIVETRNGVFVDAMPGALMHILQIRRDGHGFNKIITRRRKMATRIAQKWFDVRDFKIEVMGVGASSKVEAAKELDVYIDNKLEELKPLVRVVEHLYLFSDHHNEKEDESGIAKRVSSWENFYREVCSICQK